VRGSDHAENGALPKTQGQREAEISEAVVNYHRTRNGRGPEHSRAYLLDDMVLIRQRGTLTPAESRLARSSDGWDLLKQMRRKLTEINETEFTELIETLTGRRVKELYSDTSRTGDRIDLFILEHDWDRPAS
jgi:uncharacterized protein YbcI